MKIASLTNTPLDRALGSGKTVLAWSEGLRSFGHEVAVFAPESFYRPISGGKLRRLKMRLDARMLSSHLLAGNYDLIEFYGAEFGLLIDGLARLPRAHRPLLVAHTNGLELLAAAVPHSVSEPKKHRWLRRMAAAVLNGWLAGVDRKAFARVDTFAAICKADVDHVVRHGIQPADRCAVIEPGIDPAFLAASWDRPKRHWLAMLGSWTSRKDPETTVTVVTWLLRTDPELEFHVLGAGWARDQFRSEFPPEVRERVHVHPRLEQHEMVDVLSQSKVFFFPSLYEGFGMATSEAMACGCAVVVTPTGFGLSIRDGVDGRVCAFREVEGMERCIRDLLADDALRQKMATDGRKRVEGLTWEAQVRRLESVYLGWLGRLNGGASVQVPG